MTEVKLHIKDQIVSTARNIFNRYGFKKATMDEIAQAMGKGKSSIYYYFKSKEEIYEAVIDHEAVFLRKEITKAIGQHENPKDKLKAYVLTRMKTFRKVSNFYDAIRSEVLNHLEIINKIRNKYDREEITLLQEILEEGIAKQVFRIKEPELTATAIVTALKGLEVPMIWASRKENPEGQLEQLLEVLFYGIIQQ